METRSNGNFSSLYRHNLNNELQEINSYPSNMSLSKRLFRLVFWELVDQGLFQFFGSILSYTSPLALRVILAHVGSNGDHSLDNQGNIFLLLNIFSILNLSTCKHKFNAVINWNIEYCILRAVLDVLHALGLIFCFLFM